MHLFNVEKVKEITAEWADKTFPKKKEGRTKIAKKLQRIMNRSDFGEPQTHVAELLSVVIGEPIGIVPSGRITIERHVMIVPTEDFDSHDYTVDEPSFMDRGSNRGMRMSGGRGNSLDRAKITNIRAATNEEIDTFFKTEIPEKEWKE